MEVWQATQNWLLFGVVAGGLLYYYYPQTNSPTRNAVRPKELDRIPATNKKRPERENRPRPKIAVTPEPEPVKPVETKPTAEKNAGDATRKGKGKKKFVPVSPQAQAVVLDNEEDEIDMSTRQFAQQLTQARKGHNLGASKEQEKRTKTVKQANVKDQDIASATSSFVAVDEDDDTASPSKAGGDVSDMLEAQPSGPTSLRLTGTTDVKQKVTKQPKKEVIETKKQRQNRQKVEDRKLEREAEEKVRKAQEENQRRTAREARGEPAKNGMSFAKPPAPSVWTAEESKSHATNGTTQPTPLLDTFEAESTSSSFAGLSTPQRTTASEVSGADTSEDDPAALTMNQSVDESGWTTVALPKKQKKNKTTSEGSVAGEVSSSDFVAPAKTVAPAATKHVKASVNGKPNGFQALNDHYQQRTDVDPNIADNWDA